MSRDRAGSIHAKIYRTKEVTAVFRIKVDDGFAYRTSRARGELCDRAIKAPGSYLVGVYNTEATPEMIEEDLAFANKDAA